MKQGKDINKIISLDGSKPGENWAYVRSRTHGRSTHRFRKTSSSRGNCHFARDIPRGIIGFCYRAVVKLELKRKKFFFIRGTVKSGNRTLTEAVALRELDWGNGCAVVIPRRLRFNSHSTFTVDGNEYRIRTMEMVILQALIAKAHPDMGEAWYADAAVAVIALGWSHLKAEKMPNVHFES